MQDNNANIDPWANMGNMGNRAPEPSQAQIEKADAWSSAMSDVEFAGDSNSEVAERDDGIANASALINYGLDAAAREIGVEAVVQKIKTFDAAGHADPIAALYKELGIDTEKEVEDLRDERMAAKNAEIAWRDSINAPESNKRSVEGAFKAIADFKELITEVEGADEQYSALRKDAAAADMGYFEYAVKDFGQKSLTGLFSVLAEQKKMEAEKPEESASGLANNAPASSKEVFSDEEQTNL